MKWALEPDSNESISVKVSTMLEWTKRPHNLTDWSIPVQSVKLLKSEKIQDSANLVHLTRYFTKTSCCYWSWVSPIYKWLKIDGVWTKRSFERLKWLVCACLTFLLVSMIWNEKKCSRSNSSWFSKLRLKELRPIFSTSLLTLAALVVCISLYKSLRNWPIPAFFSDRLF